MLLKLGKNTLLLLYCATQTNKKDLERTKNKTITISMLFKSNCRQA